MEPSPSFGNNRNVFSVNSTVVGTETPDTQSFLDQARAGDAEAFGVVYRACGTRLLRQAIALCGNVSLAEELAQDTLVEAWRSLRRYHGRCEFFTWLCAILLNRYRNRLRKDRLLPVSSPGKREQDEFSKGIERLADHSALPDEAAELLEQNALVWQCVKKLPFKHQQVIYLRFYVDDSLEGIAVALGCSVGTVKSRLFHALDKLRGMKALDAEFEHLKTKG